ncbi:MAG: phosphomannomutase [Pseudotabrizicola sp.]|uniref:phosphomannomutase n=1 Tax=Pseudotabrizicola sp. TaxID=2939647 RepID=UPI002718D860|nr:phosphomannomutase [Pseudotabrizicola sp.]MDO8881943.1 phosphomannomutase [Pseudotabrizicola sp.]MDP2080634.1 phosphomannomutase [Pseudotabrizicola sp.]MDZ7573363.1 phosphomannomutase [Pseudotabrizicola sp.]
MAPKFGTSGLRGLVTELTPALVADYTRSFLTVCPVGTGLWVGRDLRDSSPMLAEVVIAAARAEGVAVTDCGAVPTPALAMAAMEAGAAAIMVTGSHIPADRNGLKFYVPGGEITKAEETAILSGLGRAAAELTGLRRGTFQTTGDWAARYRGAFGRCLDGLRVGVWAHSAVSREGIVACLEALGARVAVLGRSDVFVPVDTEAVPSDVRAQFVAWATAESGGLDAIVSTDGDGDRPLVADATGQIVPGDVLGQITAALVGADVVVTTVSANTGVDLSGRFGRVVRTRIGSPFVIAAMDEAGGRVVGYEPNGGFLLGFDAAGPDGPLPRLMTRDSLLPIVAALIEAKRTGSLAARVAEEPARFTVTDRLEHVPVEVSQALLARLAAGGLDAFLAPLGRVASVDRTDGLRATLAGGGVVHLRPSGNAPEFRVYAEAGTFESAQALMGLAFAQVKAALG